MAFAVPGCGPESGFSSAIENTRSAEEALDGVVNLALGKPTSQSSTALGALSSRAVDGNTSGDFTANSVTHTEDSYQPWWQVDLQSVESISTIEIFNRVDCCSERLSNFKLLLSDDGNSWQSWDYAGVAPTKTVFPVNRSARYVKVQLQGQNPLSLAEVVVNSAPTSLPPEEMTPPGQTRPTTLVGTIDGSFAVDAKGMANYQIPLKVPPGTHGIEPKLSLAYKGGGNGMVGAGFALTGIPMITRCPQTSAQDGFRGGVNGDAGDRFCLDGQRLMVTSGAYGADGSQYSTEIESFSRILSYGTCGTGPCSFVVVDKSGNRADFGLESDSRPLLGDGSTVRTWGLNKVTDVHGNYMTVSWLSDANQVYPQDIKYTLHPSAPSLKLRRVAFDYEDRPDKERSYLSGPNAPSNAIFTNKRLSSVKTYIQSAAGEELVRDYRIGYALSGASKRSLVDTVSECDGTGVCLPATYFDYKSAGGTDFFMDYRLDSIYQEKLRFDPGAFIIPGDYNGDGKTDFIRQEHAGWADDTLYSFAVYFSNGDGSFNVVEPVGSEYQDDLRFDPGASIIPGDYNGDGRTDFIRQEHGGWDDDTQGSFAVYLSRGDGYFTIVRPAGSEYQDELRYDPGVYIIPGDYNGDGKTDFIRQEHSSWDDDNINTFSVYLSDGTGYFTIVRPGGHWFQDVLPGTFTNIIPGDYNGDGKTDFLRQEKGSWGNDTLGMVDVYLSKGDGSFDVVETTGQEMSSGDSTNFITGDYNGDGKTDFIRQEKGALDDDLIGTFQVYFSKGNGQFDRVEPPGCETFGGDTNTIIPLDYNGDGKTDFIRQKKVGFDPNATNTLQVYISKGDGNFDIITPSGQSMLGADVTNLLTGDYDGDGKSDFIRQEKSILDDDAVFTFQVFFPQGDKNVDALAKVTNGLGASIDIQYAPLTDPSVYTKDSGAISGNLDIQSPMYVVKSYQENTGTGVSQSYSYTYTAARESRVGYGFLGFATITQLDDSTLASTTTTYNQYFPLTGSVQSQVVSSGNSSVKTEYSYSQAITAGNVRQVFLTKEEITHTEGGQSYQTGKTFEYDAYGNRVLIHDLGVYGDPSDDMDTCSGYLNDVVNWRLGYPAAIRVGSSCSFANDLCSCSGELKKTDLYYVSTWDVAHTYEWDSSSNAWVHTEYGYDVHGNVVWRHLPGATGSSPIVETTTFDPDYQTFAVTQTRAGGSVSLATSFAYDARFGALLQTTDPNGNVVAHGYDGVGREVSTSMSSPGGVLTLVSSLDWGVNEEGIYRQTFVRSDWQRSTWEEQKEYLDGFGRAIRTVKQGSSPGTDIIVSRAFDGHGQLVQESLPYRSGDTPPLTTITRDWLDRVTQTVDPLGNVTQVAYAVDTSCPGCVLRATTTEAVGSSKDRTSLRYTDARDHVVKEVDAEGRAVSFGYDRFGRKVSVADAAGTTTLTYDSFDRVLSSSSPDRGTTTSVYDSLTGRLASTTDARGQGISYSYDELGRVSQKVVAGKETVSYSYDNPAYENSVDRLSTVTVVKEGQSSPSSVHSFSYTPDGRIAAEELTVDGAAYSFSREYDPQGRVRSSTYPDGATLSRSYDTQGELGALSSGGTVYAQYGNYTAGGQPGLVGYGNTTQSSYVYDAAQRLAEAVTTGPNNTKLLDYAYSWDALHQLTQVNDRRDTSRTQAFVYSASGQLGQATGVYGTIGYAYDAAGNLTSKEGVTYGYTNHRVTSGTNFNASYDAAGNRIAETRNGTSYIYAYDGENRLTQVTRDGALVNQFDYDFDGDRILKIDADGTKSIYVSEDFEVTVFPDGRRLETRYVNGPAGRVAAVSNEFAAAGGALLDFERLEKTGKLFDKGSLAGLFGFAANRARVWSTHPKAPFAGMLALSFVLAFVGARLLSRRSATRPLAWLRKALLPGETAFSRRHPVYAMIIPLVLASFLSACNRMPYELTGTTQDDLVAGANGEGYPEAGTYYFHHNHIGSSSVVTDVAGTEVARAEYKPYGELYQAASPGKDIFRAKFSGKEWDKDSELYYFNARYYDPFTGRFMSADSLLEGGTPRSTPAFNPYAYANNSPVVYVDPSGHFFFLAIIIVAVIVGAYMGGAATNGSWNPAAWNYSRWETWVGMGVGGLVGGLSAGIGGSFAGAVTGAVLESATFNGLKFLSPEGSNAKQFGINMSIDIALGVGVAGAGAAVRSLGKNGADQAGQRAASAIARKSGDNGARFGAAIRKAVRPPKTLRESAMKAGMITGKAGFRALNDKYSIKARVSKGIRKGGAVVLDKMGRALFSGPLALADAG